MPKKQKEPKKQPSRSTRRDVALLGVILVIALATRLYKINTPLADWHSWRQADTAAVARNFARGEFNLLLPRFDDVSSIHSGIDNPQDYRFVEFPLYNALFAALYKYFPVVSLEMYGRLTTAVFSLILIAVIYVLLLREQDRIAATAASLTFAIFPFFVYYSRVILPEMTAISLAFLSILALYLWSRSPSKKVRSHVYIGLAAVFFALALLVKPTTIFYAVPMVYLFYRKLGISLLRDAKSYLFLAVSIIPLVLWRVWMSQHPEGIPAFTWLITSVNTFEGVKNIFFRPAFFRWIFYERILNLILGGWGALFLIMGIVKKPKRSLLFFWIGAAALLYLFTFQGGNVQHDYYQVMILPALAIFAGLGVRFLISHEKVFASYLLNVGTAAVLFAFAIAFSYFKVKDYYHFDQELVGIAQLVNTLTPHDARVVTDRTGDTTLLYLADRKGIPAVTHDLDVLKQKGMEYFVTQKSDVAQEVKKKYEVVFESDKVFIFKL